MFDRKALKKYMEKERISATEMGRRLSVTEGAIRNICNGVKQPSLAMAAQFADIIGCTIDDLVIKED